MAHTMKGGRRRHHKKHGGKSRKVRKVGSRRARRH